MLDLWDGNPCKTPLTRLGHFPGFWDRNYKDLFGKKYPFFKCEDLEKCEIFPPGPSFCRTSTSLFDSQSYIRSRIWAISASNCRYIQRWFVFKMTYMCGRYCKEGIDINLPASHQVIAMNNVILWSFLHFSVISEGRHLANRRLSQWALSSYPCLARLGQSARSIHRRERCNNYKKHKFFFQ